MRWSCLKCSNEIDLHLNIQRYSSLKTILRQSLKPMMKTGEEEKHLWMLLPELQSNINSGIYCLLAYQIGD